MVLQMQRNEIAARYCLPFVSLLNGRPKYRRYQRLQLDLRLDASGKRESFSVTVAASSTTASLGRNDTHLAGLRMNASYPCADNRVVGSLEVVALMAEDEDTLFGDNALPCPPRPKEDFSVATLQKHVQRVTTLIEDVRQLVALYMYAVSWKNPVVTIISLIVSGRYAATFDPSTGLSLPVALCVLGMANMAFARLVIGIDERFLSRQLKAHKSDVPVSSVLVHRPVGHIRVSVEKGRNIRSPENGLAGNASCKIMLDGAKRRGLTTGAKYDIGTTKAVYSATPVWDTAEPSDLSKRLKQLLPCHGDFFSSDGYMDSKALEFPIVQPLHQGENGDMPSLEDWEDSDAAVVVEVRFFDVLNVFPGFEYTLGEVVVPVYQICQNGSISGWFNVKSSVFPGTEGFGDEEVTRRSGDDDCAQLYLTIQWEGPKEGSDADNRISESDRELSIVVQEELARADANRRASSMGIVSSSVGALNSVRGIGTMLFWVQNTLGEVLDVVEGARNAFNFTVRRDMEPRDFTDDV